MKSKQLIVSTILIIVFVSIFEIEFGPFLKVVPENKSYYINLSYDNETILEYGIPKMISEISPPSSDPTAYISNILIDVNFTGGNGTIWINDENGTLIWIEFLNHTIYKTIFVDEIKSGIYVIWANSSSIGSNTLYYTFSVSLSFIENLWLVGIIIGVIFSILVIIAFIMNHRSKRIVAK